MAGIWKTQNAEEACWHANKRLGPRRGSGKNTSSEPATTIQHQARRSTVPGMTGTDSPKRAKTKMCAVNDVRIPPIAAAYSGSPFSAFKFQPIV